jgi:endoplasmic reticulum-Golgi intermediate compartment protein 3
VHYAEMLDAQRREGCRVEGAIRVNKVVGNFHFAPGKSFSHGNTHVHDLDNYFKDGANHTFTHKIHTLRFGPELPARAVQALSYGVGGSSAAAGGGEWSNHHINPLDGTEQHTAEIAYNYMYFLKVVSTAYLPLGWEKKRGRGNIDTNAQAYADWFGVGQLGYGDHGSIEAHQYSVTSHKRNVHGGSDEAEGHKERVHAQGGIPGVFFSYVRPPSFPEREES